MGRSSGASILKCLDGADAGTEVIYKPTTDGGIQAVAGLIEAVRDRLNGGQHDGKVSPIVLLEKDSYQHPQYGRVWMPILEIVDWMPLSGPAPAPATTPHPRNRPRSRVAGASGDAVLSADELIWLDFEVAALEVDLKAGGTFRYVADASTSAIVLAYAIGDAPALTWHANGAILDWDHAPERSSRRLRCAARTSPRGTRASTARSGITARWAFPSSTPERVIDAMIQAGVSNLPTDLESASRALGGAGKQKDGKKLIKLFCVEGAAPGDHPAEWQRFLAYARQDVEAMRDVYRRTRPLPREEWQQYWAFEHINRRGVELDMPFVRRAAALAAEDAVAIGRRLAELTGGAVTRVTQAKRIAAWLHDQLADAAMREVLTLGVPADDDDGDDDDDDGAARIQPDARSRRPRARHARGEARQRRP